MFTILFSDKTEEVFCRSVKYAFIYFRESTRERETSMTEKDGSAASCTPNWRCALARNQASDLSVHGRTLNRQSTLARAEEVVSMSSGFYVTGCAVQAIESLRQLKTLSNFLLSTNTSDLVWGTMLLWAKQWWWRHACTYLHRTARGMRLIAQRTCSCVWTYDEYGAGMQGCSLRTSSLSATSLWLKTYLFSLFWIESLLLFIFIKKGKNSIWHLVCRVPTKAPSTACSSFPGNCPQRFSSKTAQLCTVPVASALSPFILCVVNMMCPVVTASSGYRFHRSAHLAVCGGRDSCKEST